MNKDILRKFASLQFAVDELLHKIHDLEKAIKEDGKNKAWFDNGKVIVNGVEYPIQNFTVEWKHSLIEDETD